MYTVEIARPLLRGACLLLPTLLLAACGGHKQVAKAPPPPATDEVVEVKLPDLDGRGSYRFHMSDGEKRMTADEFDAWMKANGLNVAKGKPGAKQTSKR
jgi:hypothetical protein